MSRREAGGKETGNMSRRKKKENMSRREGNRKILEEGKKENMSRREGNRQI